MALTSNRCRKSSSEFTGWKQLAENNGLLLPRPDLVEIAASVDSDTDRQVFHDIMQVALENRELRN